MMEMKTNAVMSHIRVKSHLGQSFSINIDYLQVTSGQTKSIVESNSLITYISHDWQLYLRDYLIKANAKMEINHFWKIMALCHYDVLDTTIIMDVQQLAVVKLLI
jgi:hypothetical protein